MSLLPELNAEQYDVHIATSHLIERASRLGMIGAENAARIIALARHGGIVDEIQDGALIALERTAKTGDQAPLIPALRTVDDFDIGQVVQFRQETRKSRFAGVKVAAQVEGHLVLEHPKSAVITYVDPAYPGLYSIDDYRKILTAGSGSGNLSLAHVILDISEYLEDEDKGYANIYRFMRRNT